jgi:hypothetical protein
MADRPVAEQGGYIPGDEFDAEVGDACSGFAVAGGKIKIVPSL